MYAIRSYYERQAIQVLGAKLGVSVTRVGRISPSQGLRLLGPQGQAVEQELQGYDRNNFV